MKRLRALWNSATFHRWGLPFLIFLAAFTARVVDPVSRPVVWGDRAYHFSNAVLAADWATTYQRYHPGVTLMWLSGGALQFYSWLQGGLTPDEMLGVTQTAPGVLSGSVDAAVFPLALVIAVAIAVIFRLVARLLDRRVALVGALLLAFSPFHVTYSRVVHPDGLLSCFMILSALCLLLYAKEGSRRWLVASGALAGLAWLTKSPSLFLIPYTLLSLGVFYFFPLVESGHFQPSRWLRQVGRMAGSLALWFGTGALVFVLVWPAMWVKPTDVLATMLDRILFHTTNPHLNPVFFGGQIWTEDPGVIYYVATMAFKSTVFTLPGILLAVCLAPFRWRTPAGRILLALIAYVSFFTIQMGIGEFKQMAYILPASPALSLLAGIGLVWAADQIARLSHRPALATAFLVLVLLWEAGVILYRHPYPGVHHNLLLGGTRVAQHVLPQQDQGEGLDMAARYLNELPFGQDETAMIYKRSAIVFSREFNGRTTTAFEPWSTYRVYYINQQMRELGDEMWHEQWELDRQQEPLYTVDFDGVPFVWVYGEVPADPLDGSVGVPAGYRLGEAITLHSYRLSAPSLRAGEQLRIAYLWEASAKVDSDLIVFTHMISRADGQLYAQNDSVPLLGIRPVFSWRPGEILEDVRWIDIPAETPPGEYDLVVGMYYFDNEALIRVPLFDATGAPVTNNAAILTTIRITD